MCKWLNFLSVFVYMRLNKNIYVYSPCVCVCVLCLYMNMRSIVSLQSTTSEHFTTLVIDDISIKNFERSFASSSFSLFPISCTTRSFFALFTYKVFIYCHIYTRQATALNHITSSNISIHRLWCVESLSKGCEYRMEHEQRRADIQSNEEDFGLVWNKSIRWISSILVGSF